MKWIALKWIVFLSNLFFRTFLFVTEFVIWSEGQCRSPGVQSITHFLKPSLCPSLHKKGKRGRRRKTCKCQHTEQILVFKTLRQCLDSYVSLWAHGTSFRINGSPSSVGKDEVKDEGGDVDLYSVLHSDLLQWSKSRNSFHLTQLWGRQVFCLLCAELSLMTRSASPFVFQRYQS